LSRIRCTAAKIAAYILNAEDETLFAMRARRLLYEFRQDQSGE
jgi:hypothetical protein